MKAPRQIAVLAAAAALLSGCGLIGWPGSDSATPATRPTPIPSELLGSSSPAQSGQATSAPTSSAAADLTAFYDQDVKWSSCGSAECATITVPLDYADPEGPTIDLAMVKVPATGDRVGALFVNPGGPGGSAIDYARAADYIVTPDIRKSFDIVGVDPRGVGQSAPVNCISDIQLDVLGAIDGTPDSPQEEQEIVDVAPEVGEGCAANASPVFAHVSTVDSARDLDIARAAVGDEALTYLGKSYGKMLGATYAELFPDRVGRMVLDGVLPADYDIVEVTKGQADAFEVAVRDFAKYCLRQGDCPLTGSEDEAVRQLQDWLTGLDGDPIPASGSETRDLNEALAAYAVLANLYFPSYDYPRLKDALKAAMTDRDSGRMFDILDARISRGPDGKYLDNSTEAFYAITCLDRPYEGTVEEVRQLAEEWKATAPTFGPALAWGLLPCKDWPATSDQVTSTVAAGSNPILVVSTRKDPATPYEWGVHLAEVLENGHLVSYDGVGHTAYGEGSSCVDRAVDDYLLKGTVPEKDPNC